MLRIGCTLFLALSVLCVLPRKLGAYISHPQPALSSLFDRAIVIAGGKARLGGRGGGELVMNVEQTLKGIPVRTVRFENLTAGTDTPSSILDDSDEAIPMLVFVKDFYQSARPGLGPSQRQKAFLLPYAHLWAPPEDLDGWRQCASLPRPQQWNGRALTAWLMKCACYRGPRGHALRDFFQVDVGRGLERLPVAPLRPKEDERRAVMESFVATPSLDQSFYWVLALGEGLPDERFDAVAISVMHEVLHPVMFNPLRRGMRHHFDNGRPQVPSWAIWAYRALMKRLHGDAMWPGRTEVEGDEALRHVSSDDLVKWWTQAVTKLPAIGETRDRFGWSGLLDEESRMMLDSEKEDQ